MNGLQGLLSKEGISQNIPKKIAVFIYGLKIWDFWIFLEHEEYISGNQLCRFKTLHVLLFVFNITINTLYDTEIELFPCLLFDKQKIA